MKFMQQALTNKDFFKVIIPPGGGGGKGTPVYAVKPFWSEIEY